MNRIFKALALSCLLSTWTSNSYTMAHVVSPEVLLVPLKNGSVAPAKLAFDTHLAVTQIIESRQCFAVRELLENCMNNSSDPVSDQSARILMPFGLLTQDHKPLATLTNILKSMVRGKGEELAIINPVCLNALP